jgi:hypothetical protein
LSTLVRSFFYIVRSYWLWMSSQWLLPRDPSLKNLVVVCTSGPIPLPGPPLQEASTVVNYERLYVCLHLFPPVWYSHCCSWHIISWARMATSWPWENVFITSLWFNRHWSH